MRYVDGCKWCVKVYRAGTYSPKNDDTQKIRFQLQSSFSRNAFFLNNKSSPAFFFGRCITPIIVADAIPSSFAIPIQWPMFQTVKHRRLVWIGVEWNQAAAGSTPQKKENKNVFTLVSRCPYT